MTAQVNLELVKSDPKISLTQNIWIQIFGTHKFFWDENFFGTNPFWMYNLFGLKMYWRLEFEEQQSFTKQTLKGKTMFTEFFWRETKYFSLALIPLHHKVNVSIISDATHPIFKKNLLIVNWFLVQI